MIFKAKQTLVYITLYMLQKLIQQKKIIQTNYFNSIICISSESVEYV